MGRFADPQDPLFKALNSSISFDKRLAPYDLEQSLAHARMLAKSAIIGADDLAAIERGLAAVRAEIEGGSFVVNDDDEDIHMAIERRLTEIAGPVGGKLHTARSRNDQVATDVAMLVRAHSLEARSLLRELMGTFVDLAERHLDWPLPGYTHLQRAQPVYLVAPPARLLLEVPSRPAALRLLRYGHGRPAARSGRAGGGQLRDRPAVRGPRARLRGHRGELAGRGVQPRLRPRLPERRRHLRRPPLGARR